MAAATPAGDVGLPVVDADAPDKLDPGVEELVDAAREIAVLVTNVLEDVTALTEELAVADVELEMTA